MSDHVLPNRLKSGDVLVTKTGSEITIVATSHLDKYDEPFVRIKYASGIVGNQLWTRDDLQQEGCRMKE